MSKDYRDFIEFIDQMSDVKEKLDLDKIPHFTTLQKFVSRIPSLFNIISSRILMLFYSHGEKVSTTVIDAKGFTSFYASQYHSNRTGKLLRSFLKTSISIKRKRR